MRVLSLGGRIAAILLLAGVQAPAAPAQAPRDCTGLAGQSVPATLIGLPSGDAALTSADVARIPLSPAASEPSGAYCRVLGEIKARDPSAPPIRFQINLPEQWNGRAVQYGGGGFNGHLVSGLNPLNDSPLDVPVPVARGYATWGTDSGHDETKLPELQAFALNDEALENFAFGAYKKVRDVAVEIVRRHYGRAPERVYYFGASEGGREGLTMAQRFPEDFDGIVSVVPVINWVGLMSAATRNGIVAADDGWINAAKGKLLHGAVLDACDGLDGLVDGVVSRYARCASAFDPQKLRCENGTDSADTCLSDAQIALVKVIRERYAFPFPLANGITSYPGYNYGGEVQNNGRAEWTTFGKPPPYPTPPPGEEGQIWYFGAGATRYFLAGDPRLDPRKFRPQDYQDRVKRISALMDSTDPDLGRFRNRGGKLIMKENMADFSQSPFAGTEYYERVVDRMGQQAVDAFMRLYVTPGADHLGNGVTRLDVVDLPRGVDLLGILDGWVTHDREPGALVQTAQDWRPPFSVTASRPLCRYPAWPRYDGSGSPKEAQSFACVTDDGDPAERRPSERR
jgi:feruloyl esterase